MRLVKINNRLYNLDALVSISEWDPGVRAVEPTLGFWEPVPGPGSTVRRVEYTATDRIVRVVFANGDEIDLNVNQSLVVRNILLDGIDLTGVYDLDEVRG